MQDAKDYNNIICVGIALFGARAVFSFFYIDKMEQFVSEKL